MDYEKWAAAIGARLREIDVELLTTDLSDATNRDTLSPGNLPRLATQCALLCDEAALTGFRELCLVQSAVTVRICSFGIRHILLAPQPP